MIEAIPTASLPANDSHTACAHCQADCGPSPVVQGDLNFCCEGCRTVYHALSQPLSGSSRYAWLDAPEVRQRVLDFSDGTKASITLSLPTIHCYACIETLERLYQINPAISFSRVNYPNKKIYITFQEKDVKLSEIASLLDDLSYPPELRLDAITTEKAAYNNKAFYFKLGIAGFCFGNIMMLSFPEYLNFEQAASVNLNFFNWLNVFLSIPVFFYSAIDYHKSAIASLRRREINIDVPLSLGLAALFVRSAFDILVHAEAGYLDSMAGLVFFLLIGRWFRNKTYDRLSFERDYTSYFPISVTRIGADGSEAPVAVTLLQENDVVIIRNGEVIPADAVLESREASIDYSFVTGEAEPVQREQGELLFAGGRQTGRAIMVRIARRVSQSYLTQLWENEDAKRSQALDHNNDVRSKYTELSGLVDFWGKYFTYITLGIAVVAGTVWSFTVGINKGLDVATAVLMVACPCALALTIPVMMGHVLRIMGRNKFFVRSIDAIAEMAASNRVVVDKTGTLTHKAQDQPIWMPLSAAFGMADDSLTEDEKTLVRTLSAQSSHPLSRSLSAWTGDGARAELSTFEELTGKGLLGVSENARVLLGSASWIEAETGATGLPRPDQAVVYMAINGTARGYFAIPDRYRDDWQHVVAGIGQSHALSLLSGDTDRERASLEGNFPAGSELRFQQSPHDKQAYVAECQAKGESVVMLGDGLNDAGALRQANAGIALSEDTNTFSPACDAILDASSFDRLPTLLRYARVAMKGLKGGFVVALFYNAIGLGLAVAGWLSPLVAAILMPISSVSVVLYAIGSAYFLAWRLGLNVGPVPAYTEETDPNRMTKVIPVADEQHRSGGLAPDTFEAVSEVSPAI